MHRQMHMLCRFQTSCAEQISVMLARGVIDGGDSTLYFPCRSGNPVVGPSKGAADPRSYAAVLSAAIGAAFYLCRGPMIAAFTSDPPVHFASTTAMVPTAAMAAGLWLKVPEGVLIGAGDGRFVSLAFIPAFAVTSVGLWATARWGLGLPGIWAALLAYYVVLIASFLYRWLARVGAGGWAPPSAPPEVGSG